MGDGSNSGRRPSDTRLPPTYPPLGKFNLIREIGRGAMGVVYEGLDTVTGRKVAVKLLNAPPQLDPRESKPAEDRFLREARLSASIAPHPGIVAVLEAGVIEGRRYLAMELVRGIPLSEWRKQASLTLQKHVALIRDIALAAHHAHEHGVVHRDLKPENILVDRDHRVHVTDFGLAKALAPEEAPSLTATGMAVGTPYYMSPEQVQGKRDVDRRTDVYALGVMLYEVLAGRKPFTGDSSFEIMTKTVKETVLPPSRMTRVQINPVLFRNLENICLIALSKDPGDRYPTAQAFARDLTRWLKGEDFKVVLPRAWRILRARQAVRRLAVGGVVVALALAATFFFMDRGRPARPAAAPALQPGAVAEFYSGTNFNALGVRRVDRRDTFVRNGQALWDDGPRYWASFRWTAMLEVPRKGDYVFETLSKEGVRLVVDGMPEISNWGFHLPATDAKTVTLEKGWHRIVLEYYHTTEQQTLQLSWKPAEGGVATPITPATLFHDPASFVPREPPGLGENGTAQVTDAQGGEELDVLECTADRPISKLYDSHRQFWRGRWEGNSHLWWGRRVKPGDRLRLRIESKAAGRKSLVLALTRGSDHGLFKVSVNGTVVAPALDLYDPDLKTGEAEFKDVEFKAGANELEFQVAGSNPQAREWGPGTGLHKIGLDYVLVK